MSDDDLELSGLGISRTVRAQAAAWVAHLHAAPQSTEDQDRFRTWLDHSPVHRLAFGRATAAWEASGAYDPEIEVAPIWTHSRRRVLAGAGVGAIAAAAGGFWLWPRASVVPFSTGHGEQFRTVLADGSTLMLDSASRLEVRMSARERRLVLTEGRAFFKVRRDPSRPFVVDADGREIIAVGTEFEVGVDRTALAVLLIEGKVLVQAADTPLAMRAGDRLRFGDDNGIVRRDRPDMSRLTSWQRGTLVFEDERLASVLDQMNRYSAKPLRLVDPALSDRMVSGSFVIGDSMELAHALGPLLNISVEETDADIQIGDPSKNSN